MVQDLLQGEFDEDISENELDEPIINSPVKPVDSTSFTLPVQPNVAAPSKIPTAQESLPEMPLSTVAEAMQSMTEFEPVEQLKDAQPDPDVAIPEIVSQLMKDISPSSNPRTQLEAAAAVTTLLSPPIVEESEVSSPTSNQMVLFEIEFY